MQTIQRAIARLGYNIYVIRPLSQIGWFMAAGLILWTLLSLLAYRVGRKRLWDRLCGWIAFLFVAVLLYMTLVSRTEGDRSGAVLRPFYTFYLARKVSREYYREMLMNVFLFFPLGLTLPFGLGRRRRPLLLAIGIGAGLSAGIEILQFVFALGLAEVDDVIMNTLGTMIGSLAYGMTRVFSRRRRG